MPNEYTSSQNNACDLMGPSIARPGTWSPPKPAPGLTWQIQLNSKVNLNHNVSIFDIDLFQNTKYDVAELHRRGIYVICYFSAGTWEPLRDDLDNFNRTAPGLHYDDPSGHFKEEQWFNTTDPVVRDGMAKRILRVKNMGCDAVDPDNVDTYDNETGFNAKPENVETDKQTSIDYISFLSNITHKASMQMSLKNAPEIVDYVIHMVDFQVNENCANSTQCWKFRKFIADGRPLFEIEYPTYLDANSTVKSVDKAEWARLFKDNKEQGEGNMGFSTAFEGH
ncbi:uncharacterized protein PAC_00225 [Phialocephala subalpina]|uniref:alpha-galactosidase n=1 Tax=Phialocephala subalpina TaxID=576137 RepID=A0A1L7WC37_9HELO|nr:uncharacterized protein PAC_00225 [Phialocephala subalpina]